jgi:RNA polymerase sigma-70 factor (ECF subfamily)
VTRKSQARTGVEVAIETAATEGFSDARLEQLLVERYPDLIRLAFLILHDQDEAEDATQVALERAWRSRSQIRSASSAVHWLRRIVVREALRARTSPWRRLRFPLHLVEIEPPGARSAGHVERLDVLHAFYRLPADQSVAVVLHHYLAYPIAEVAEMVGAPPETVRSRLRLAMRRLREELRDA